MAGAVSGLAAGILGIGSGIVMVPVLYHVMATLGIDAGIRMQMAIANSLAAIIPASLARAHGERGVIDWPLLQRWTVPMLAGVGVGSLIAGSAGGQQLALAFAAVALLIVLHLTLGNEHRRIGGRLPGNIVGLVLPALVGAASSITGIGANAIGVSFADVCGVSRLRAAGTAAMVALIVAASAVAGAIVAGWHAEALPPYSFGYLNLVAFALIAPVVLAAEAAGVAVAHMIEIKRLRLGVAALIAIATARMLWDALA